MHHGPFDPLPAQGSVRHSPNEHSTPLGIQRGSSPAITFPLPPRLPGARVQTPGSAGKGECRRHVLQDEGRLTSAPSCRPADTSNMRKRSRGEAFGPGSCRRAVAMGPGARAGSLDSFPRRPGVKRMSDQVSQAMIERRTLMPGLGGTRLRRNPARAPWPAQHDGRTGAWPRDDGLRSGTARRVRRFLLSPIGTEVDS